LFLAFRLLKPIIAFKRIKPEAISPELAHGGTDILVGQI
jgi:hypothetical protein